MVHSLRKYLSNRGSALFMVISTMTALMITCMAMYFAVISSRSAQYAVFNQGQSYQTARSASSIILNGLSGGTLSSGSNNLFDKMVSMEVGDEISTDGNGFATLNPDASGEDDETLGAYDVTITRLEDEMVDGVLNYTYDVAIVTSVNGAKEAVHSVIHIRPASSDPVSSASQVFAATGYSDQDTYLDGGAFLTDMFIDTENAVINAYPAMQNKFYGNLSAGGSLQINGYVSPNPDTAVTWAIRNKLYESPNKNFVLQFSSTSSDRSVILVGGDLDMGDNWGGISNADIYVNGDFYYGQSNYSNCNVYVHGNIYIRTTYRNLDSFKSIYCDGSVIEISGGHTQGSVDGTWALDAPSSAMSRHDAMTMLDNLTSTTIFYKWVINDSDPTDTATYVRELDEARNRDVHKTLHWDLDSSGLISTITLEYGTDGTGCIIDDTTVNRGNNSCYAMTLIIDTGDDPDNVYTIRVSANRDIDGDGTNESFCWSPISPFPSDSDPQLKILVKGRGSVVIDVPEGVVYQDTTNTVFCHYNWWVLAGGSINTSYGAVGSGKEIYENVRMYDTLSQFVHSDCQGEGDDGDCHYTETTYSEPCEICGGTQKQVTCERHEYTFTYCPSCDGDLKSEGYAGSCTNRVDRKAIDDYLAANSSVASRMEKDSGGSLVYPTVNIFLVSVEESADIRLSITKSGGYVSQNAFFGYIYAPYMTFKGYGSNSGGGLIRFFGGATVSDFIFQDSMSFVTCWPEKLPEDLMSEASRSQELAGSTSKDWKISLGSY